MKRKKLDETQLVERIQAGDNVAFEELYDRYWEELYQTARQKTDDGPLAENLVQEVFVTMYIHRKELLPSSNVRAYLHTILKNKVIDEVRRQITRENYIIRQRNRIRSGLEPAYRTDAHQLVERKELWERIRIFTETLPKKCREVFLLKQQDLSNKEIASQLQISEKTVEGHFARARRLLTLYFRSTFLLFALLTFLLK